MRADPQLPPCWPQGRALRTGEVNVLHLRLDHGAQLAALKSTLSEVERGRARAFADERLQTRYACGRGLVRTVLGRLLCIPPAEVSLTSADNGKPKLAHPVPIRFNLSHSGDIALLALTRSADVGVDLEHPSEPEDELLEQALTARERAHVEALPAPLRARAFARLWVRKEALLKAAGCGLREDPAALEVPTRAVTEPVKVAVRGQSRLWLMDLPGAGGYVAAVATEVRPAAVRYWQFGPGPL